MTTYGSDRYSRYRDEPATFNSTDSLDKRYNYSQHLQTIHLAGLHLLLSMSIFALGVYMEIQWMADYSCQSYYLLIYIRCAFWFATYILDTIITYRHNDLRRQGYHSFYRNTVLIYKNAPLIVVTLWNTVIFIVQTILLQNYESEFASHCQKLIESPITYTCIFCGCETILLTFVHGSYIMKIWHFNNIHALPDALRELEQPFIGSLGITIENARIADLLEKQADLIYYLKEQNLNLNRKLMQLNKRQKIAGYDEI